MDWFDRILSVAAGFAGVMLFANMVEIDWQLALMSIRDATSGRWVPEFRVDADLHNLKIMLSR